MASACHEMASVVLRPTTTLKLRTSRGSAASINGFSPHPIIQAELWPRSSRPVVCSKVRQGNRGTSHTNVAEVHRKMLAIAAGGMRRSCGRIQGRRGRAGSSQGQQWSGHAAVRLNTWLCLFLYHQLFGHFAYSKSEERNPRIYRYTRFTSRLTKVLSRKVVLGNSKQSEKPIKGEAIRCCAYQL
ncbi:hypothetical protein Mp_8g11510 [Marchantia polymorpha subsp. ruderalis]|uniref:Uncharacterized protein n=1 Tax=Marchantia polymorpha TaxID=3197 RepID=A0A2R6XMF1_MARPO|nr:hypothetical protein MARPO_0008s0065 [Marchantia polymorpha]BBN19536.1 hypothetical protein Mp_8g11510 [Marchantia polymorpha subsp. ruderalis]|eukprot:PTQ47288.1 hypothetical protein MARPO_0008s0065 [Marchantia polymorpha]